MQVQTFSPYPSIRQLMDPMTSQQMRANFERTTLKSQMAGTVAFQSIAGTFIKTSAFNTPPVPIPISPWFKESAMLTGSAVAVGAVSAALFAKTPGQGAVIGAVGGAATGAIMGHFIQMGSQWLKYALPAGIGLIGGALGGYLVSQGFQSTQSSKNSSAEDKPVTHF